MSSRMRVTSVEQSGRSGRTRVTACTLNSPSSIVHLLWSGWRSIELEKYYMVLSMKLTLHVVNSRVQYYMLLCVVIFPRLP